MDNSHVSINEQELKTLKKDYDKAVEDGEQSFTFKGREVLVSYAKYMIEYLEGEFKKQRNAKLN
jgi:hypothetical protein